MSSGCFYPRVLYLNGVAEKKNQPCTCSPADPHLAQTPNEGLQGAARSPLAHVGAPGGLEVRGLRAPSEQGDPEANGAGSFTPTFAALRCHQQRGRRKI